MHRISLFLKNTILASRTLVNVMSQANGLGNLEIDMSKLEKGIYIIQIGTNQKIVNRKIVKM